jgi:hypothetical protein
MNSVPQFRVPAKARLESRRIGRILTIYLSHLTM